MIIKIVVFILSIDFLFRICKYGPMEIKSTIDWWKKK